jgi:hypothetical protein
MLERKPVSGIAARPEWLAFESTQIFPVENGPTPAWDSKAADLQMPIQVFDLPGKKSELAGSYSEART